MSLKSTGTQDAQLLKFVVDFAKHAPATIFLALSSVIIAAVYTRIYTPDQYGIFSSIVAIVGPIITILTEWAAQPVGRMYTEYKNSARLDSYWKAINTMVVIVSGVILALSLLLSFVILPRTSHVGLYVAACCVIFLQSITSILLPVFPASFRADLYRRFTIATVLLTFFITLILIGVFGKRIDFLLWGQVLALFIVLPFIVKQSGWKPSLNILRPDESTVLTAKRMVTYGLPMMLWFLGSSLLDISDRYVIQWFRGNTEVALYSVNYSLMAGIIMLLNVPVGVVLGPILFEQWSKRDVPNTEKTLDQMTSIYIYLASCLVGVSAFVAPSLTQILIGKEFQVGTGFLVPVLFARAVWGLSLIGQKSLELREKTLIMMYISIASAVVNLLLNLAFIPKFGYVAAAYTTLVSYIFYGVLIWFNCRKSIKWCLDIPQALKPIIAASTAFYITKQLVKLETPFPNIILGSLTYLLSFIILITILSPELRLQISKYVLRK